MITELLLNIFYYLLRGIFYYIPDVTTFPGEVETALSGILPTLIQLNNIFPVDTFFIVFGIFLGVELALLTWKAYNWIINKIRGSG